MNEYEKIKEQFPLEVIYNRSIVNGNVTSISITKKHENTSIEELTDEETNALVLGLENYTEQLFS